jgi:hypothetical protein
MVILTLRWVVDDVSFGTALPYIVNVSDVLSIKITDNTTGLFTLFSFDFGNPCMLMACPSIVSVKFLLYGFLDVCYTTALFRVLCSLVRLTIITRVTLLTN